MKNAYLGLGSNQGDRLNNLKQALDLLFLHDSITLKAVSSLYETAPVGGPPQGLFLNACIQVSTLLSPTKLLQKMLSIEKQMGRIRRERWGPRIIDLDLLHYEGVSMNTPLLEIPHPRLAERSFVLVPLNDIASELKLPGYNLKVKELLALQHKSLGVGVNRYHPPNWYPSY